MAKIEFKDSGTFEVSVKRFYLPAKVRVDCPGCGHVCEVDLNSDQYLSHQMMNSPEEVYMYCDCCEEEWYVMIVLSLSVKLATSNKK